MAITITEPAKAKIKSLLVQRRTPDYYLKIGLRGGGCSGFTYEWEPLEKLETEKEDLILDLDTGHLILDGMSVLYLAGMEVDYKKDLFGQRLMVENPNVKSMCGCGESFTV